jgi:hypothetical protein
MQGWAWVSQLNDGMDNADEKEAVEAWGDQEQVLHSLVAVWFAGWTIFALFNPFWAFPSLCFSLET